jgi:hypothetical protein
LAASLACFESAIGIVGQQRARETWHHSPKRNGPRAEAVEGWGVCADVAGTILKLTSLKSVLSPTSLAALRQNAVISRLPLPSFVERRELSPNFGDGRAGQAAAVMG